MIVWLTSYPRSGNTFLRIGLNRLYGIRSSVIYDFDGVAQRLGDDLVGFEERAGSLETMRASAQTHFIKTHAAVDDRVADADRALHLVRDGRDCLTSWARLHIEDDPSRFEGVLAGLIDGSATRGRTWGSTVLSWLDRPATLLRYEDLVAAPEAAIVAVMAALCPSLAPRPDGAMPSFAELQALDPGFFSRGRTGGYRDDMPERLEALFWAQPDNAEAMRRLGYPA